MTIRTLDQALPMVQDLARRKADAFARRFLIAIDEREDVRSQLVIAFLAGWPKYDHARASVQTFASRLMDKELVSLLRYRLAGRRRQRPMPVFNFIPSPAPTHLLRIGLSRALAPLPQPVRHTAELLSRCSATEAAKAMRCSRQMICRRKRQIREALVASGYHTGGASL